ncbi:hypothetical protein [Leptospira interrogans]|uniref:hypothetical protein n=1 Tax=Leptospira interrogans TaxID=173 RepID=UPI0002BB4B5D|nr:hypothetical protein [Leptospira interrogans]QOI36807.1 hypothetical protein LeptoLang_21720 [Leptospira interrogans serovar Icterohaemorrhagiae]
MKIHICDICNKHEQWNDSWSWEGDLEDFRDEVTFKVCSEKCKLKSEKMGKKKIYKKASVNRFNEREINRPQGIVKL